MGDLTCQELESQLLDSDDPRVVEHLKTCQRCQRRVAFAPRLAALLHEAEYEPPVPAGLNDRLRARLDRIEQQRVVSLSPRRRSWARPLAGLAALAACLAVVFFLFPRRPTDPLAIDMVDHHETCFAIANSPGREQHFQEWLSAHPGVTVPVPRALPRELAEVDRRDCPVGEGVHGPHLMYRYQDREQVSLYVVPVADVKGMQPRSENPALAQYKGYNVLVWESGGWLYGLVSRVNEPEMRKWVAPATALRLDPRQFQALHDDHTLHTRPVRTGSHDPHRGPVPVRAAAL